MAGLLNLQGGLASCNGAELHLRGDGTYMLRLVKISLQKKLVHIDQKKEYTGSLKQLVESVDQEPLAITLTGKGVLIKRTEKLEAVSEQSLQRLFPQMKLAEFYVQHFPAGAFSFIAMVRKEIVDEVTGAFKKGGTPVALLSLGPFVVDQVLPQLNAYSGNLQFDGHQVILNEAKEWDTYQYHADYQSSFPIKVDIEVLPEVFLLGYATAFQLILNDRLNLIEPDIPEIQENLRELSAKLKFRKYGTLLLLLFFVLLMVNFLLLSRYTSDNQVLMSQAGQKSDLFENRQKLEESLKQKEGLVKRLGWNKGYPYAYLCDQIGQTVPAEIKLDEIQINPLLNAVKGLTKESQLEVGQMRIRGQAKSVYSVNDWIYLLKEKKWVKEVRLEKYTSDDQKQTQVFTIHLSY